jgi:hypothetical protein
MGTEPNDSRRYYCLTEFFFFFFFFPEIVLLQRGVHVLRNGE